MQSPLRTAFQLAPIAGLLSIRRALQTIALRNCATGWTRSFSACLPEYARERRTFTEAEDRIIMQRRHEGADFTDIAAQLDRKRGSVRRRFFAKNPHLSAPKRPKFDNISSFGDELQMLRSAGNSWRDIAAMKGKLESTLRSVYSRYRVINRLGITERAAAHETTYRRYTPEEDHMLLTLRKAGLNWSEIGSKMKRSPLACEQRYRSNLIIPARDQKAG